MSGQEREALAELVRVKDLKGAMAAHPAEYAMMKEDAWAKARAALAAREDTERPEEVNGTLCLRASNIQTGYQIYARGDWWKVIGHQITQQHVTLTAESSDGVFSSSRTYTLDHRFAYVLHAEPCADPTVRPRT